MVLSATAGWRFWVMDTAAQPVPGGTQDYLLWVVPVVVIWYAVLEASDAYEHERVGGTVRGSKRSSSEQWVVAAAMAISAHLFQLDISRAAYVLTFGLGLVLLLVAHGVVRELLRRAHCRGMYMRPVVAVGRR